MDTSKIIRGPIGIGPYTRTAPITQWDYGYRFIPDIDDLPATYRIDFANNKDRGEALPVYGDETGAEVPEELIATGKDVFAFYVHIEEGFARTAHTWRIPNHLRAKAGDREPTPSQQDSIDQLISRSNAAVTAAEQSASDAADSAEASARCSSDAQDSAEEAAESATNAEASKQAAAQSEANAAQSESTASAAATSASASAQNASRDADRAEQAAAQSGYMFFYIDENGDLHYQRTDNVDVDFYLNDGDLYVRAGA